MYANIYVMYLILPVVQCCWFLLFVEDITVCCTTLVVETAGVVFMIVPLTLPLHLHSQLFTSMLAAAIFILSNSLLSLRLWLVTGINPSPRILEA